VRKWLIGLRVAVVGLIIAGIIITITVQPRVKRRVEKLLADRFDSDVKIGSLSVTLIPQASVMLKDVELRFHHRTDVPPMIAIGSMVARSDLPSLLLGAQHDVSLIRLEGLRITIPSGTLHRKQFEPQATPPQQNNDDEGNHLPFLVHRIIADGTVLVILPKQQGKEPLEWDIEKLTLRSVGPKRPMAFTARLTNAKPPGMIHSEGKFGPWQKEDPGGTAVSGNYTFKDADMGVFKGLSGMLSSEGEYGGSLDHIDVNGTTDIPTFQVGDGSKVDLKTKFSATVDGTNGDTMLHPVDATFMQSEFICNGGVIGTPGIKGKKVQLDVVTKKGRIEDILMLVLKPNGDPPLLGAVSFKTKFLLPQGDVPVIEKLFLDGQFGVTSAEFTSDKIQDKLDQLSNRSRGLKGSEKRDNVASNMRGKFILKDSVIRLSRLSFNIPGIWVNMSGTYGIRSERINFDGTVQLEGKLSQMTSGWKSLLLKAVDPFFRDGNRTVLPVKVEGTRSDPKFGLDLHHSKHEDRGTH
jgi:hypothetical protein